MWWTVAAMEELGMRPWAWSPPGLWCDGVVVVTASFFHMEESLELGRIFGLPNETDGVQRVG